MKLIATLTDGRELAAPAAEATFLCRADRAAFERQFNRPATDLDAVFDPGRFDEDGNLTGDEPLPVGSEDWAHFAVWRALRREDDATPPWEVFADTVADFGWLPDGDGSQGASEEGGGGEDPPAAGGRDGPPPQSSQTSS